MIFKEHLPGLPGYEIVEMTYMMINYKVHDACLHFIQYFLKLWRIFINFKNWKVHSLVQYQSS